MRIPICLTIFYLTSAYGLTQDLPNISNVVFSEPSEDQRELLLGRIESIELMSVADERLLAQCEGAMGLSGSADGRTVVRVVEFRFAYAEDAKGNRRRLISAEADAFRDEGATKGLDGEGDGSPELLDPGNSFVDVLIMPGEKANTAVYSRGGKPETLKAGIDPLALMQNRIIFSPFNAVLLSTAELKGEQLIESAFHRFNTTSLHGYGVVKDVTLGRWFFNQRIQGVNKVQTEHGLIRWIGFRNGLPVVVEDRFGLPKPTGEGRAKPFSRTEIRWSEVAKGTWRPTSIRAEQGGKFHTAIEIDAKISWASGEAVPESVFSTDSVGKFTFGAPK